MSDILNFYRGTGTDAKGRTFDEVLAFDDDKLERCHDYIQWLFPLPEPSKEQPQSPRLSVDDIEAFQVDPKLRVNVGDAFICMFEFYAADSQWLTPKNHNFLRITRIIRFLALVGHPASAHGVAEFATMQLQKHDLAPDGVAVDGSVPWYWQEALKPVPAWL